MRRAANAGGSSITLENYIGDPSVAAAHAAATDASGSAAPSDAVIGDPDAPAKIAGALPADDASNGGLAADKTIGHALDDGTLDTNLSSASVPDHGAGWAHALTSDDNFWFDPSLNPLNDHLVADGSANLTTDGFAPVPDALTNHWNSVTDVALTGTKPGLFHDDQAGFIVTASSGTFPGHLDAIDAARGGSSANGAGSIAVYNDPGAFAPPSSPADSAPILAWIGDTGIGSSHGASSGGGSGGGTGTAVHTTSATSGFVINVVYDSSVNSAPAGFTTAVAQVVNYFESHFSNPMTVTVDVGFGEIAGQSLGANALGESETYLTSVSYAQLETALAKNANAIGDAAAAASLPASSPVSGQYWLSTAEARALGVPSAASSVDGYVGFSNIANLFAYNDANGVPANQYDFFGVVAHEFSEIMGRQMMDGASFIGAASYEPLDLFHYSAPGIRDFSGTRAGYASADGGTTSLDSFNTNPGGDFGDWATSAGNDAFRAFSPSGVVDPITAADLTLMNLLGWDPVASSPPPPAPTPVVTMHLASDTGVFSTDNITSNDALTGTADPNALVKFMSGTQTLGTTTANASGAWSFTPAGLADGQYTIIASDTNSAGHTGTASLTFTFDKTAPIVTSDAVSGPGISAGAGTLTAGQTIMLTVNLSEAVSVANGVPSLTLNDGGTATYDAAHSSAKALVFDYTVAAGQYTNALAVTGINLHGALVTDVAGNAANFAGANAIFSHLLVDGTTPVAAADHAHDMLGGAVVVSPAQAAASGVLSNDSDSNPADLLSVSAVNGSAANVGHTVNGSYGTLALNGDGSYSYTNTNSGAVTAAGGVAEDTFNYTVSNGHGGTANSALSVLITSPGQTYVTGAHGSSISGGTGSYVLDGSAGNMNVTAGHGGAQWLVGGSGDTLNAGSSADTFLFAPGFGRETINNFNTAQDLIDLPQSLFANFAAVAADMHASGANTVITLDANDAITLSHVAVANLHAQNFHFLA